MAPETADGRTRVLYICGWGRSGTTLVDRVLGELPGFVSVGELRTLWDCDPATHLCACGQPVDHCVLWAPVLARVLGSISPESMLAVRQQRDGATRSRHIPTLAIRAHRGPGQRRPSTADDYGKTMAEIYTAVLDGTKGQVVVDSSKHPADALLLASRPELDLTVLHLVRDPRAVGYSWRHRRAGHPPALGDRPPERGVASSSAWWTIWNGVTETFLSRGPGVRYLRLRYEDLMAAPRPHLEQVAAHFGRLGTDLPFRDEETVRLGVAHTVAGNPNRAQTGLVRLSLDAEWISQMNAAERILATLPALPLLHHYGYPVIPRAESMSTTTARTTTTTTAPMAAARSAYRRANAVVRSVQRTTRLPGDRARAGAGTLPDGIVRVYHHHVRKTGGTSLNRAFLGVGGEDPSQVHWRMRGALHATRSNGLVFVAHDRPLLEAGHYFYGWDHAPAWSLTLPAQTFTLTVLRDPIARVVSLYRYLADPRADDNEPFGAGRRERALATQGFGSFLDRLPKSDLLNQLHMFSEGYSVAEAADRIRACSAWFMTERYDQGVHELGAHLGLDLAARWDRRSVGTVDVVGPHVDRLAELMAPEYQLLKALADDPGNRLGQVTTV
jgi:hypothetical protein